MKTLHRHSSAAGAQSALKSAIDTAVYRSICEDSHHIDPPKVSPELWDYVSIQSPKNRAESERLEFLGDALMDACIAIELYKTVPDGNPHKYSEVRSALHSNYTFCHIVHKMGLRISADTKSIGDVFETMIGAFYTEKGFGALHDWVKRSFEPIIEAAAAAFDHWQTQRTRFSVEGMTESLPGSSTGKTHSTGDVKGKRRFSESAIKARETTLSPTQVHISSTTQTYPLPENVHSDACSTTGTELSRSPHAYTQRARTTIPMQPQARERTNSSSESNDSGSEDNHLPEFWEERRLPDGQIYYVDHSTQTTTWDRPRNRPTGRLRPSVTDPESAWTARLVLPLPPLPTSVEHTDTPSQPRAGDHHTNVNIFPAVPTVVADLLRDGYVFGNNVDDDYLSPSGHLPEFYEEVQASNGQQYYIDHPAGTIFVRR
ncbi:hypothetical protein BC835DRAFT_1544575 [Cytidiella melzeri]|nr:hypothetical protein BC835DRAFT_1544575 [Cytidiella melzeri]